MISEVGNRSYSRRILARLAGHKTTKMLSIPINNGRAYEFMIKQRLFFKPNLPHNVSTMVITN